MTREEKSIAINNLIEKLADKNIVYLADISGLNSELTSNLRRACFKADIKLEVVKNTLLAKAFEGSDKEFGELDSVLKGNTTIMISDKPNGPAKVIKSFRKNADKPILKGAYINEELYIGDDKLDSLVAIKSKEELIGDIIGLLQSPARNIISALQNKFADGEKSEE